MYRSRNKIVGIGCDFQTEGDESSRKLAIENLSGGEKQRVSWMISNMYSNKAFKYKTLNKSKKEREEIFKNLCNEYLTYRKNWKNQPLQSFKKKLSGKKFKDENHNTLCFD